MKINLFIYFIKLNFHYLRGCRSKSFTKSPPRHWRCCHVRDWWHLLRCTSIVEKILFSSVKLGHRCLFFYITWKYKIHCSSTKRRHVSIRQQLSSNEYFREMARRAVIWARAKKQKYFLNHTVVNQNNFLL